MLCKCRMKRQTFPLRTPITCPLGFCATTGFPFGACVTAELEGGKKGWKNTAICFLIVAWQLLISPSLVLLVSNPNPCTWTRRAGGGGGGVGTEGIVSVLRTGRVSAIITQLFLLCCRSRVSHNVSHLVVAELLIYLRSCCWCLLW